jgi:hypothetical protein
MRSTTWQTVHFISAKLPIQLKNHIQIVSTFMAFLPHCEEAAGRPVFLIQRDVYVAKK